MSNLLQRALIGLASISIFLFPSSLVAGSIVGNSPALVIGGVGIFASGIAIFIALSSVDLGRIPLNAALRSSAFIALCLIVTLGLVRTPWISDAIRGAGRSTLLSVVPAMFMIVCTSASIRDNRTQRRFIGWIVAGAAIIPVVMMFYDTANGATPIYFAQWMTGTRVLNTGFVSSANMNALIGAFGALASIWLMLEYKSRWPVIGIVSGIFYVMIAQSKGVMLSAGIGAIFIFFPQFLTAKIMRLAVLAWLISAPLQIVTYSGLEGTSLGVLLTRAEGAFLGVGTGRSVLWSSALKEITDNPLRYIIGTGYMSAPGTPVLTALNQVVSTGDVSEIYQRVFSLHNAALQMLFDNGLIALFLLTYCLLKTVSANVGMRVNALLLFVLLSGFNESVGTVYAIGIFVPFWALIGAHSVGRIVDTAPDFSSLVKALYMKRIVPSPR
jgi:hypothetical protein